MKVSLVSVNQIEKCPIHSLSPLHYLEAGGCHCTPRETEQAQDVVTEKALEKYPPFTEAEIEGLRLEAIRLDEAEQAFQSSPSAITTLRLIATINAKKVAERATASSFGENEQQARLLERKKEAVAAYRHNPNTLPDVVRVLVFLGHTADQYVSLGTKVGEDFTETVRIARDAYTRILREEGPKRVVHYLYVNTSGITPAELNAFSNYIKTGTWDKP